MSSFYPKPTKPINKNQSLTFKNALQDINNHNEYDFAPHIQQYNFGSFSPRDSKQLKPQKKSSIVKESFHYEKEGSFRERNEGDIIEKLKRKVQSLERQNSQLKSDKQQLMHRIQKLQLRITQLNKNLSFEKSKHNDYQVHFHTSLSNKKSLEKKLSKQNSLASPSSSRNKTLSNSPLLLKELLLQCNESRQFDEVKDSMKTRTSKKEKGLSKWDRDQFYEYKNTKDCFSPFFQHLSRELQLRCKKAMIRDKELIYKDDYVQIGCISQKLQDLQFELNVVITNLQTHGIKNLNVAYLYKPDIQLQKQVKSTNLDVIKSTKDHTVYRQLNSAQQIKENLMIKVNTVDFRCIVLSVQFDDSRGEPHKITQILPGCKHRLLTYMVATPIPQNYIVVEKVIVVDKKFLPDLQKLKSYYKTVHFTTDRHKNVQALVNVDFLAKSFFISFKMLGVDKMTIAVHHNENQAQLAEKVLGEFVFVFER